MPEAPSIEKVIAFQKKIIESNQCCYFAIRNSMRNSNKQGINFSSMKQSINTGSQVIGWIDIWAYDNPRFSHRAALGMGIAEEYRSMGIGSLLMQEALKHSSIQRLEVIELLVYECNSRAQKLYEKFGFITTGKIPKYRKLDGQYYHAINMCKYL